MYNHHVVNYCPPMNLANRIETWPLDRLKPYAQNARTHDAAQVAKIAASMAEFGFTNPILVDSADGIIAGHGRLMAARELGLTHAPVIVLDHLSDAQRRAYVLADNRLALDAGWDHTMLAAELAGLQEDDFDLDVVGFSEAELAALLGDDDTGGGSASTGESGGVTNSTAEAKPAVGAKEYGEEDFAKFAHQCPKCGFEFNDK